MTLKELGLSDEEVQDIIASLVASDANVNWTYDDTNDELTVSLDNSVSVSTLEAGTITDGANVSHSDELADAADVSSIQSSGDVVVTDTQVGTLADGEFLQNSGGSLVGGTVNVQGAFSNIEVFESDGTFDASDVDLAYVEVVGGGGGGASTSYGGFVAQGGGGGGYSAGYVNLESISSVAVTVGSGGIEGYSFYEDGNQGESSSFGTFISATGGLGGGFVDGDGELIPRNGGQGSGGDIVIAGGRGSVAVGYENLAVGGAGGDTPLSTTSGAGAVKKGNNVDGGGGIDYGGGGGASVSVSSDSDGGRGADGVVIVRY